MTKNIPINEADAATVSKQARFWKLLDDKEDIQAKSASLRVEYEKLRQEEQVLQARQKVLADQFKVIEEPIFAIDMERSRLARELGGKTGERPSSQ